MIAEMLVTIYALSICPYNIIFVQDKIKIVPDKIFFVLDKTFVQGQIIHDYLWFICKIIF